MKVHHLITQSEMSGVRVTETGPVSPSARLKLFFLNGRFGPGGIWKPLIQRLADHFPCFTFDLPGFGQSVQADNRVFSLREHTKVLGLLLEHYAKGESVVLLGHDVGGAIVQLCALDKKAKVNALVLLNSAALLEKPTHFRSGWFGVNVRRNLRRAMNPRKSRLSTDHRKFLCESYLKRSKLGDVCRALGAWEHTWPDATERSQMRERLREFPNPVLLLWGKGDTLNDLAHTEELLRIYPDAYLFEHDQCGHWPSLEVTDWVDEKLREFLFRLQTQTGTL